MPLPPPDEPGKLPRRADALRGNIARLVSANTDRVAGAESDARAERERQDYRRRLRKLAAALSGITRSFGDTEFELVLQISHGGDFTAGQLLDYLISKLDMNCHGCGYFLRGLPPTGNCPECGHRYYTGVLEFESLKAVLAEQLEIPLAAVNHELWVLARLRELCRIEEDRKAALLKREG
jgi:hypothetical protein